MVRRNTRELNYARLEELIGRPLGDLSSDGAYRLASGLEVARRSRCRHPPATPGHYAGR